MPPDQIRLHDCRDAFASVVVELAAEDDRVVVVCSDSVGSSKLEGFRERFPERLVNVGIAEQTLIGVAAGLANGGMRPIVAAASCFITARALEQLKVDLAYSDADVLVCGMSPGVSYGALGPTHHSLEDVAWLRPIDNLTVIVPADPTETEQAIRAAASRGRPAFVRVSRMGVPEIHRPGLRLEIGRAIRVAEGRDVTLIANGTMVSRALAAASLLEARSLSARVVSMHTVKPLDRDELTSAAKETGAIVTIEEHSVHGGLGGAIAEHIVENAPVPMKIMGFSGFAPTGSPAFLLDHAGLAPADIAAAALETVARKR